MFKLKHALVFFLLLTSIQLKAMDFYTFKYRVEEGETFSLILKKFVKDASIINSKTPLVKKIVKNNPQVKSWDNIPAGTILDLYLDEAFIDKTKYETFDLKRQKKITEEKEKVARFAGYPMGLKGSIFFMSSMGIFNQSSSKIADINFKQNSPATIGTSFTYYPKEKLYSFAFSGYFSYLLASANNLTTNKITIPGEVGVTGYGEYRWEKKSITVYSGMDYESFSTFSLRGIQNEEKVYVDGVKSLYFTFGAAKAFSVFQKQIFAKLSLSKSIMANAEDNAPHLAGESSTISKYDGYKMMFYLNYKFSDKMYAHTMIKYHTMTGPSDLSTLRIGVGFGYILF